MPDPDGDGINRGEPAVLRGAGIQTFVPSRQRMLARPYIRISQRIGKSIDPAYRRVNKVSTNAARDAD
jgi:hypothetical protein